jgi:tRNA-splicing ligase RtcB
MDAARSRVVVKEGVDATLFASDEVTVESNALDEFIELMGLADTIRRLADARPKWFAEPPELSKVALTPDFHKGSGVPIGTVMATRGFVVPAAIGNDVNCGMRLHATSLTSRMVEGRLDALETRLRRAYFEGGRDISMTRSQREALFREGITGLLNAVPRSQTQGLWRQFHRWAATDLKRIERQGSLPAHGTPGLEGFLGSETASRDSQIGSIGGGNHFVEIQRVERVLDGGIAHAWGLSPGQVMVMVHTGSVSIGHLSGGLSRDVAQRLFPKDMKHPNNGIFVLPVGPEHEREMGLFWDCLHNAANFAFGNRLFLALMAATALEEEFGEVGFNLVYDAPHNLVWHEEVGGRPAFVHRKGACPAHGMDQLAGTPFEFQGEPVIVPGSMGAPSFLMVGLGNEDSLRSASHGAGRALSRGEALKSHDEEFREFLAQFRIVTPVDFRRADVRMRRDIMAKKLEDIRKEAPFAYKEIGPVVKTLEAAGIARSVAELRPLLTVKG